MGKRNPSKRHKRKTTKKQSSPMVMVAIGVGVILLGFAAIYAIPKTDASSSVQEDEYSSVPIPVEYPAPELALATVQGEAQTLADYQGQVVLVNLWATWCPPCKEELPVLEQFYEDHVDEGFVIIGIDFGESADVVDAFIKTTNLTYPIWVDEASEAGRAFNSYSLPASFVIDRDGTVRLAWTGAISQSMLEKHVTPVIEE